MARRPGWGAPRRVAVGWGGRVDQRGFARYGDMRLRRRRRGPPIQALACALGLLGSATIGLGLLYGTTEAPRPIVTAAVLKPKPAKSPLVQHEMALFNPALTSTWSAAPFARTVPLRSHLEHTELPQVTVEAALEPAQPRDKKVDTESQVAPPVMAEVQAPAQVQDVPLPARRPSFAATPAKPAQPAPLRQARIDPVPSPVAVAPPSDGRTLLERMFGAPATPSPNPALAYATPGDTGGGFFGSHATATAGTGTAVYNIAKHTVTLPNGTQLEAHSGLGARLDDPTSVGEHMRGATPPTIYELTQREALFHGVRALRLTPLMEGTTYGRGGLLAHTFMLGPRGDSNGCVVFRNYAAFLAAYDAGQIRRLLVVAGI